MHRYLLVLPRTREGHQRWRDRLAGLGPMPAGLRQHHDDRSFLLLSEGAPLALGDGAPGMILGDMFARDAGEACTALPPVAAAAIDQSAGMSLFRDYWGSYIAVLPARDGSIGVLRAPLGNLPVYVWRSGEDVLIASDPALLIDMAGYVPAIDPIGVSQHLVAPERRGTRTCLSNIEELPGGWLGRWHQDSWNATCCWRPNAGRRSGAPDCRVEAAARLEQVILTSVAAKTRRHPRLVLLLSGGLDSSISGASLAEAGHDIHALTMVTSDAGGDERGFARLVAERLGISLTAVRREPDQVDVTRSAAARAPRPVERSFSQATNRSAVELACRTDATAIAHGGGGDNLFCALQSAAPLADRLRARGPDREALRVAREIAAMTETSLARVIRQGLARAFAPRAPASTIDTSFLSPLAAEHGLAAPEHAWITAAHGAPPGAAAHIRLIAAAQSLESIDPCARIPSIPVLLSQPIAETCLSLPSWWWFDRGCNRAVARHAFARRLPDDVTWRTSKGAMDSFVIELFERNRTTLRALLLDGVLAATGLLDVDAVRTTLDENGPIRGAAYGRIMHFADVEAWARSW